MLREEEPARSPAVANSATFERIVLVAPFGRDQHVLSALLSRHGFRTVAVGTAIEEFRDVLQEGADVVLLTAEAFGRPVLDILGAHCYAEPVWSMPPVVLIAENHVSAQSASSALRKARPGLPVSILIRPCAGIEIVSAVGVAVETRRRQVRIKDLIARHQRAEKQAEFLFQELGHRVKNLFSMVSAIAVQTSKAAPDGEKFRELFRGRIEALANTYAVLGSAGWQGAQLGEIVASSVGSLLTLEEEARFVARGPEVEVPADTASGLGIVLHELAANARKYGALSGPEGRIDVVWQVTGGTRIILEWREHGGPPVTPPSRTGFGTKVITGSMNGIGDAEVDLQYPSAGVYCRIAFDRDGGMAV